MVISPYLSPIVTLTCVFFFFNDTATTEIYTLSLHDALPICGVFPTGRPSRYTLPQGIALTERRPGSRSRRSTDRKSTRLNSSHDQISYAVFCLKKKISRSKVYWQGCCRWVARFIRC